MRGLYSYLPIFGVLVSWGLSWPLTKIALHFMSPYTLSFMRFALGSLFFLIVAKGPVRSFQALLGALLNGALFVTMVNFAVRATANPALASSLVYTQPLFVVLFSSLFLRERLHRLQIVGVLLAFSGILVSAGSVHGDIGSLLAVLSGLLWSSGILYYRRYLSKENLLRFNASLNLFSVLVTAPVVLFSCPHLLLSQEALLWGLLTASVSQVAGFFLWFLSLKTLGTIPSSTFSLLVPAAAYLFTYLILNQAPAPTQIVGSSMTLLGVLLSQIQGEEKERNG